jgi:hypothetical protein
MASHNFAVTFHRAQDIRATAIRKNLRAYQNRITSDIRNTSFWILGTLTSTCESWNIETLLGLNVEKRHVFDPSWLQDCRSTQHDHHRHYTLTSLLVEP